MSGAFLHLALTHPLDHVFYVAWDFRTDTFCLSLPKLNMTTLNRYLQVLLIALVVLSAAGGGLGRYLWSVGRLGEGPGEFRNPFGLWVT